MPGAEPLDGGWSLWSSGRLAALAGFLLSSGSAGGVEAAPAPAAYASCVACHGQRAEGNVALQAPAIAGQDATYLKRQLLSFRSGTRGKHPKDTSGAQMRSIAVGLVNDATIDALSVYVAALPRTAVPAPAGGDLRKGTALYHGKCGACHGGRAEGNPALNAPRLVGLDAAYLKRQFAHFRDGLRGSDAKDRPGRQMALMAKTLATERELDEVIAFIQAQGAGK